MKAFARLKGIKRIFSLIAVCAVALLLTGCGASLTVYDYTADGVRYHMYELSVDNSVVDGMEKTAVADKDGKKYSVKRYFYELFTGFGYELVDAEQTDKAYTVRYRKPAIGTPDLFKYGSKVEFKTEYKENPFVRTYKSVSPNPFNGLREAYDEVEPYRSSTVLEQLKNGIVARDEFGEWKVIFPSVRDAFPYVRGADPDGLPLNYVFSGARRMTPSGITVGSGDRTAQYMFKRYFDRTATTVEFEYRRAVPYGWYLIALAAGAATIGIIVLATRKKKHKPTLLERFPYNPEEYRDYDNNLPSNLY